MESSDMLKQLLEKFSGETAMIEEEFKLINEQISQLEQKLAECHQKQEQIYKDKAKVLAIRERYLNGKFEPPPKDSLAEQSAENSPQISTVSASRIKREDLKSDPSGQSPASTASAPVQDEPPLDPALLTAASPSSPATQAAVTPLNEPVANAQPASAPAASIPLDSQSALDALLPPVSPLLQSLPQAAAAPLSPPNNQAELPAVQQSPALPGADPLPQAVSAQVSMQQLPETTEQAQNFAQDQTQGQTAQLGDATVAVQAARSEDADQAQAAATVDLGDQAAPEGDSETVKSINDALRSLFH